MTHEDLRPLMLSIAYRMVGSFSEAEDIVQEAFVRLTRAREDVEIAEGVADHRHHAAEHRPPALGARAARGVPRHVAAGAAARRPGAGRGRARRDRGHAVAGAAGACSRACRRSSAPCSCCTTRSTTATARSPRSSDKSEDNCRQIAVRARAGTWTRGGRGSSRRASSARSSRAASSPRCRRARPSRWSSCWPPTPRSTATAAARRRRSARRCSAPTRSRSCCSASRAIALRDGGRVEPTEVNGQPGRWRSHADGSLISVMALEIVDGAIAAIRSIPNPDKIAHISSTILPSLPPDLKRS